MEAAFGAEENDDEMLFVCGKFLESLISFELLKFSELSKSV
jgi:hypothetical protein